ncbi:hypothetical protein KEM48_006072 [Puccinia striiformis f. sp. tritici PST-130]|nr:hypothetical protein KEM48_006072 [Puccinia striiformis f. sp. tritici PST-130]
MLSTGRLLSPLSTPSQPIDLVWTWANHSKPREDQGILTAATQYLYREHDELSLAIESQFGHLSTIHDNFLYLNDDCFFINKFSQGDFSSELFGPVFRIQFDLKVEDDQINRSGSLASRGEWPSLGYSNYLLSERFGKRDRRYLSHLPKVLNIHILNEVSEIWREEIFILRLLEEAMLHSFIMLQSDQNQDGMMTRKERKKILGRIAHEKPECGDCLLALLIGQQSTGIESLYPHALSDSIAEWLDSNILATRPFSSFNKLAHGFGRSEISRDINTFLVIRPVDSMY